MNDAPPSRTAARPLLAGAGPLLHDALPPPEAPYAEALPAPPPLAAAPLGLHTMSPPRLLICAVAAAGLALLVGTSLVPPVPIGAAAASGHGLVPSAGTSAPVTAPAVVDTAPRPSAFPDAAATRTRSGPGTGLPSGSPAGSRTVPAEAPPARLRPLVGAAGHVNTIQRIRSGGGTETLDLARDPTAPVPP